MFVPAMVRALRGYGRADFLADLGAGVTVGIIALPLAIGFGIASGVTPQQGLWTGIIASIAVALFGGSRFQIAGPTGAFVPVLFSIVAVYGYNGLALATLMAGAVVVGVALVVLIPFLRRLITDKAELPAEEIAAATPFRV